MSNENNLLDKVLAAYSEVQPPAGLEARVLGAIETRNHRRRRGWWFLGSATVAASAVLFLWLNQSPDVSVAPRKPKAAEAVVKPQPVVEQAKVEPVKVVSVGQVVDAAPERPRRSTFPAASRPSEAERALLSLMQSDDQGLIALAAVFDRVEQIGEARQ